MNRPHREGLPATAAIRALREPLLRWYRRHRRDLPWRRTRDPYAIWVSEAMLQQTQVATVLPYYARFLDRFPDLFALAEATDDEVLARWSGLGYYRRASALRDGARAVVKHHGGAIPEDPALLLALPGIGRYTAGAVASLAFGREEPVLDGNVKRVFARLFALEDTSSAAATRRLWAIAAALVKGPDPGGLNQAVMELGATVCTPRAPRCADCPVSRRCAARAADRPEAYPEPRRTGTSVGVRVGVAVVERAGSILMERRRPDGALRGSWDLPSAEADGKRDAADALAWALSKRYGLRLRLGALSTSCTHAILQKRLRLEVFRGRSASRRALPEGLRWVPLADLDAVPVSGATRKVLRAVGLV